MRRYHQAQKALAALQRQPDQSSPALPQLQASLQALGRHAHAMRSFTCAECPGIDEEGMAELRATQLRLEVKTVADDYRSKNVEIFGNTTIMRR